MGYIPKGTAWNVRGKSCKSRWRFFFERRGIYSNAFERLMYPRSFCCSSIQILNMQLHFVLHGTRWRTTSDIIVIFSPSTGRVTNYNYKLQQSKRIQPVYPFLVSKNEILFSRKVALFSHKPETLTKNKPGNFRIMGPFVYRVSSWPEGSPVLPRNRANISHATALTWPKGTFVRNVISHWMVFFKLTFIWTACCEIVI